MAGSKNAGSNPWLSRSDGYFNILNILGIHAAFLGLSWLLISKTPTLLAILLFVPLSLIHIKFLAEFLHEGAHFNFFHKRSLNDFWSNLLAGFFIGTTAANYRRLHFQHHAVDTFFQPEDPETAQLRIQSRRDMYRAILADIFGITGLRIFLKYTFGNKSSAKNLNRTANDLTVLAFGVFHGVGVFAAFHFGLLSFYVAYFFTLGTIYPLQLRIRILGQHLKLEFAAGRSPISYAQTTSRTIEGGILERLFFTSSITAYHDLHHRYPQLPFRHLKQLHAEATASTDPNIYVTNRAIVLKQLFRSLN